MPAMCQPALSHLPAELIRSIAGLLPSADVLALRATCRTLLQACNDWTLWRHIVTLRLPRAVLSSPALLRCGHNHSLWENYLIADSFATGGTRVVHIDDVDKWLPHIVTLQHPILATLDSSSLRQLCDPICDAALPSTPALPPPSPKCSVTDSTTAFNLQAWQRVQAAAFCLSARLMSPKNENTCKQGFLDDDVLYNLQWFQFSDFPRAGAQVEVTQTLRTRIAMLHALANRVVGFFQIKFAWALRRCFLIGGTNNVLPPPTASSIPFPSLLLPPIPFSSSSLDQFSTCHLACMTDPSFFVDDEWAGCISHFSDDAHVCFDAIGGDNFQASLVQHDFPIERFIRFQLSREWEDGTYELTTNYFRSQLRIQRLKVVVHRSSGCLTIARQTSVALSGWAPAGTAAITPFGIVEGHSKGYWTWLWKREWSAHNF